MYRLIIERPPGCDVLACRSRRHELLAMKRSAREPFCAAHRTPPGRRRCRRSIRRIRRERTARRPRRRGRRSRRRSTLSSAPPRRGRRPACRRPAPRPARCRNPRRRAAAPPRAAVELAHLVVAQRARGTRRPVAAESRSSRARSGPSPTIFSGTPTRSAGLDGDVEPLVGHERGHDQDETARRAGRPGVKNAVSTGGYTTVDRAIIVSADPARNILRIRHDSGPAGPLVPRSHRASRPSTGRSTPTRARADPLGAEIGVELVPGVAHRRVAVADVPGAGRARRPTWPRSGCVRDHQVVIVEVEAARRRAGRAAGSAGSSARRRAAAGRTTSRSGRRSIGGETEPRHVEQRVRARRPGTARRAPSSTFSPPRMPVSQSWTSATRAAAARIGPPARRRHAAAPAARSCVDLAHPPDRPLPREVLRARDAAARASSSARSAASASTRRMRVGDRRRLVRIDQDAPRRRPPRAATRRSRSSPACRWPSPRAAAGRSLVERREDEHRRRAGRAPPASGRGTKPKKRTCLCSLCRCTARRSVAYFEISSPMMSSFRCSKPAPCAAVRTPRSAARGSCAA